MISLSQKISFCLSLALVLLTATAGASLRVARPIFNQDRKFIVSSSQNAFAIQTPAIPAEVIYFESAQKSCSLAPEKLIESLEANLRPGSPLWSKLDLLFPSSREQVERRKIKIFVDDFTEFAGERPDFTSYFVKMDNQLVIGLSCHEKFRGYWDHSLVHEFTHALLSGSGVESWWEEGLAQMLEMESFGEQPALTLKHLKSFPVLLETRRPLPSKESYAINQLFVRYILNQFGSWPTLRAMTFYSGNGVCESEGDFLAKLACRGKYHLEIYNPGVGEAGLRSRSEQMTRAGLLRYFAVAMTLNDGLSAKYSIPGWQKMKLPAQFSKQSVLAAGQFVAWEKTADFGNINPQVELYRVLSDDEGHFVILSGAKAEDERTISEASKKLNSVKKNYFLLINTGLTPQKIHP